jgi:hypothetical protein
VPTDTPTPVPTPVYLLDIRHDTSAGQDSITDGRTLNSATTNQYEYGTVDAAGLIPPAGEYFLWTNATESDGSDQTYHSAAGNFRLEGSDGRRYPAQLYGPLGGSPDTLLPTDLGPNSDFGTTNSGWIKFIIPAAAAEYTLSWNEDGRIPFTPFASILVGANTKPAISCPTDGDPDDGGLPADGRDKGENCADVGHALAPAPLGDRATGSDGAPRSSAIQRAVAVSAEASGR